MELIKILTYKEKVKKILGLDENEDKLMILPRHEPRGRNGAHSPFYVSLLINDLLLHNCMLDSGASTNVMSLKVMNQLGLQITWPYRNVCTMDSREIKVHGLIKDL
jgi:hypothetical protein